LKGGILAILWEGLSGKKIDRFPLTTVKKSPPDRTDYWVSNRSTGRTRRGGDGCSQARPPHPTCRKSKS